MHLNKTISPFAHLLTITLMLNLITILKYLFRKLYCVCDTDSLKTINFNVRGIDLDEGKNKKFY